MTIEDRVSLANYQSEALAITWAEYWAMEDSDTDIFKLCRRGFIIDDIAALEQKRRCGDGA